MILCFSFPLASELYGDKVMVLFTHYSIQQTAQCTAELIKFLIAKRMNGWMEQASFLVALQ